MPCDIKVAREQFKRDVEEERDIRAEASKDMLFRSGDQWHPELKRLRDESSRPALTFDKTHIYIQAVANEARQNKPQATVNPIGGGATADTAVVINGILRHIAYRSQADIAKDTALDYSCGSSFGYIRAITEFTPKSFDQEVRILPVNDPFCVYGVLIPYCRGQRRKHAFVVETITREEYRQLYGTKEEPVNFQSDEWKDAGDWIDGKNVRIAEYWYVTDTTKTLREIQGQDGSTTPIYTDDKHYSDKLPFVTDPATGEPMEREEEVPQVKFCKIDGARVLPGTETDWTGDVIPIFPVIGQQLIVEGEVKLFSLIRFVRDPQQLINVYKSAIAEKIALGNRVPYLGYKGQFKDPKWQDANTQNYAYLEAEPIVKDGVLLPLPQRQQLEEQIQALSMAAASEIDDLKSGMGIYDASLGNQGNETSGLGINARQQQSNVTNLHFADNLNRSDWDMCSALLKVIPKIYDRPGRQQRIVGEDEVHSVVILNQPHLDPDTGKPRLYALDVGDYDVCVKVGPSYTTARQEGAQTLSDFFKAAPQTVPILGDLWVGDLDYPWSREAARRLKASAPQNIVNDPDDQGGGKVPQQVQQQMMQLQQDNQKVHAFAQNLHEQLQSKQPDIDSRERIAMAQLAFDREKLQAEISLGEAKYASAEAVAQLREEIGALKHERLMASQAGLQSADQQHQQTMQASGQAHQVAQQDSSQAATADQQAAQAQQPQVSQ